MENIDKNSPIKPVHKGLGQQDFVRFAIDCGVLKFGQFETKAGRISPYFFNAGLFNDGEKLLRLAQFYANAILASNISFDMVFGPAYKGIVLAAVVAAELARLGRSVPFAYNRKETKDHGEGGSLVGAPLSGRVLIIDDVISAGTAVRESIALIKKAGALPQGLVIALDRQEKANEDGQDLPYSAVQYLQNNLVIQVVRVATLDDVLAVLCGTQRQRQQDSLATELSLHRQAVEQYRRRYGV